MRRVSVTQLKNQLSRYLRLVKRGETLEIIEHSVPIATVAAIGPELPGSDDGWIEQLVREGIVTRAKEAPSREFLKRRPVPCRADLGRILRAERDRR